MEAKHTPIAIESKASRGPRPLDELAVDDWLHIEQMSEDVWWIRVGHITLDVIVGSDGRAREVTVVEDAAASQEEEA